MKRVLLFGPPFFSYTKHIQQEIEVLGYAVDYFNDHPSDRSIEKGVLRLKPSLLRKRINHYLFSIEENTRTKLYEVILIINGRAFTAEFVRSLKKAHPESRVVLYLWDSLTLYPQTESLITEVDEAFSFDSVDCARIKALELLPLFYIRAFAALPTDRKECTYDLISVCTAHPNRYQLMSTLFPVLQSRGLSIFSYLYIHKLQYVYYKWKKSEFKKANRTEFRFEPLPLEAYLETLKQSRCVFDMQHASQQGLTMRTIETLGAKKKLITANRNIKQYDFYDSNNILIFDETMKDPVQAIKQFMALPFRELPQDIYQKYSIQSFTKTLIKRGNK